MNEVVSIDEYVARGLSRVQAIKKHYEDLKKAGGPSASTSTSETNRQQLEKRYQELQDIKDQKGFVQTAVQSVNMTKRLSSRFSQILVDEGENRDSFEAEKLPEPAPQTAQQQGKLSPKPPASKGLPRMDSNLDSVIDEDDPFPHFNDTETLEIDTEEDFKSPTQIEVQSSEPTMDNVSSFLGQSDYSLDEEKEFHYLIDQGFNIDEASDLVYQRRLNNNSAKKGGARMSPNNPQTSHHQSQLSPHQPQQQHSNQSAAQQLFKSVHAAPRGDEIDTFEAKRIPLRSNALTGSKDADIQQLLERGYTYDQATEICDIIYADREDEKQRRIIFEQRHAERQFRDPKQRVIQQHQQQQQHGSPQHGSPRRISPKPANTLLPMHEPERYDSPSSSSRPGSMQKSNSTNSRNLLRSFQRQSSSHPDLEALKLTLLVSEQEAEFGINMYDSLQPEDEDTIAEYMGNGYTLDEAVFEVFTGKINSIKGGREHISAVLRGLIPPPPHYKPVPAAMPAPPPPTRNILVPVREAAAPRDSPTMQQMNSNSMSNNISNNSSGNNVINNSNNGGSMRPFSSQAQPLPSLSTQQSMPPQRIPQPIRMPPVNNISLLAPGIQQSLMPPQGSPNSQGNAFNRKGNVGMSSSPIMSSPMTGGFPPSSMGGPSQPQPSPYGMFPPPPSAGNNSSNLPPMNPNNMELIMGDDEGAMLGEDEMFGFDVDFTAAKNIENEIELLMMTGYTRESAVRFLLDKAKREPPGAVSQQQPGGPPRGSQRINSSRHMPPPMEEDMMLPLPVPMEIQIRNNNSDMMTVTSDLTQSVIMSVNSGAHRSQRSNSFHPPGGGREGGGGGYGQHSHDMPSSSNKYYDDSNGNNMYHSGITPYQFHTQQQLMQQQGNNGRNNNHNNSHHHQHNNNVMHQRIDEEDDNGDVEEDDYNDDYPGQYDLEDAALDIKHMYPYLGFEGIYNRQPSRSIYNLPEEERALKVGILISTQSATFDTNMYESITPEDEPMINSLLALGYDEDETYLIIFERKFGPPGIGERSVARSVGREPSKKSIQRHGNGSDHDVDNASTESLARILMMSKQEHEAKPGFVKMPGINKSSSSGVGGGQGMGIAGSPGVHNMNMHSHSSNSNNERGPIIPELTNRDFSDINPRNMEVLVSMGFSTDQVVHALRMNAYDLHSAAQFLLGGV